MPCRELTYTTREDWADIKTWLDQRKDPDTKVGRHRSGYPGQCP